MIIKKAENNGLTLIENLLLPGRLLVFVDDSGTHGKPMPSLAADYECLCGLQMTSEAYAHAKATVPEFVRAIPDGIEEFHSNEIVNPSEGHPWRSVPLQERADVLRGLFACVAGCTQTIYRGFYSGEQMRNTPKMADSPKLMAKGAKSAVESVFRNCLVPHLLDSASNPVIAWDSAIDATQKMKVETLRLPGSMNTCDIIHADSRFIFGLQLADLIAYSFNRQFRIKHRAEKGIANEMDEAILDGLILLKDRFVDILELPDFGSSLGVKAGCP